jgi:hypothetical protein
LFSTWYLKRRKHQVATTDTSHWEALNLLVEGFSRYTDCDKLTVVTEKGRCEMKIRAEIVLICAAIFLMAGYQAMAQSTDIVKLGVNFKFDPDEECGDLESPPIDVSNIPPGTKWVKFDLIDTDNGNDHGNAILPYEGSGHFPKDAFTKGGNYYGPCSAVNVYKLSVEALDASKNLVLGKGEKSASP